MSARDLGCYLFLAIVWGHSFVLLLQVVNAFGWAGAVSLRALLAGLTLALFAWAKGYRGQPGPSWWPLAVVGATSVAGQLIGMSYATPLIGTAMAAILVASIPLFSVAIGRLWGLEKLTVSKLFGLLLGFCGIVLLVGFPDRPIDQTFIIGCAASIGGAICSAYGSNYASLRLASVSSVQVTYGSFLAGGLIALPLLIWVPVPGTPQPLDYLYLLLSACLMSAVTYVLYYDLIKRIGATRTISVEFVVTLIAVLIGALFLGENLTWVQVVGGAVVLIGCVFVLGLVSLPERPRCVQGR